MLAHVRRVSDMTSWADPSSTPDPHIEALRRDSMRRTASGIEASCSSKAADPSGGPDQKTQKTTYRYSSTTPQSARTTSGVRPCRTCIMRKYEPVNLATFKAVLQSMTDPLSRSSAAAPSGVLRASFASDSLPSGSSAKSPIACPTTRVIPSSIASKKAAISLYPSGKLVSTSSVAARSSALLLRWKSLWHCRCGVIRRVFLSSLSFAMCQPGSRGSACHISVSNRILNSSSRSL
mmetsp:Transcript_30889/g.69774  ORF Transcript_30889/g.69774 Transcript_30889/m.69774 type:complete len:235 (-) Transcript_30889:253-957(-)